MVEDELATEALILIMVRLCSNFKYPVAYVLQDKCNTSVKDKLIEDYISLLC